jgi:hypothetical protein
MTSRSVFLFVTLMLAAACNKSGGADVSKYPGTEDGAKQLVTDIRTSSEARAMTLALKPTAADCKAVFVDDAVAAKAEAAYDKMMTDARAVIAASADNTELTLSKATTDDLQKWTAPVQADFPGGYKRVADKYKPGLTVYRWKYVKPGEQIGTAYDGLIYVNNHWAWFPRPWRVLGTPGED